MARELITPVRCTGPSAEAPIVQAGRPNGRATHDRRASLIVCFLYPRWLPAVSQRMQTICDPPILSCRSASARGSPPKFWDRLSKMMIRVCCGLPRPVPLRPSPQRSCAGDGGYPGLSPQPSGLTWRCSGLSSEQERSAEIKLPLPGFGTKRTCRAHLTMSVDRDRPEVVGRTSNRRIDPSRGLRS
jgi:hypothetical protein